MNIYHLVHITVSSGAGDCCFHPLLDFVLRFNAGNLTWKSFKKDTNICTIYINNQGMFYFKGLMLPSSIKIFGQIHYEISLHISWPLLWCRSWCLSCIARPHNLPPDWSTSRHSPPCCRPAELQLVSPETARLWHCTGRGSERDKDFNSLHVTTSEI